MFLISPGTEKIWAQTPTSSGSEELPNCSGFSSKITEFFRQEGKKISLFLNKVSNINYPV
jgi:hypothetical protein